MRDTTPTRRRLVLAFLLVAPIPLYIGFLLPAAFLPFTQLSGVVERIHLLIGGLVVVLWVAAVALTLFKRVGLALEVLTATIPVLFSSCAFVVVSDPIFHRLERREAIQQRFDAAAAAYPRQVWCNGGFAYLRQEPEEVGYDVMLHLPPSQGEFALRVVQFRVSDEHRTCDASLFDARYAVARRWFDACREERVAFETLVDEVRRPSACPHPVTEHWPGTTAAR